MPLDFYGLSRGDALPPLAFQVSAEESRAYLDATGEPAEHWADTIPPLAPGAFVLAALMEQLPLPGGALHTGQEFEFLRAIAPGEPLEAVVTVAQRSERRGTVIVAFEFTVSAGGEAALTGRSTVVAPTAEGESAT